MKKSAGITCLIIFSVFCFIKIAADEKKEESAYFRWAVLRNENRQEYKLFFQPLSPCFYYLIRIPAEGKIVQILPEDFYQLQTQRTVYKRFFLPSGKHWLHPNKGEACYLLVSTTALGELEKTLNDYFYFSMLSPEQTDVINRKKEQVLKIIRALFARSVLEDSQSVKPESILGVFRDTDSLLEQSAEKIKVKKLYANKIVF